MNFATQSQLGVLRDLLNFRLAELRSDEQSAELARHDAQDAQAHEVADQKDLATQRQMSALDDAQARRDRAEIIEIEAALQRLDDGSFGNCVDCGEPIALSRLLVQPAAQRCSGCQTTYERGRT